MEFEKYAIKKDKTDMLSSLKLVNKKIIKEKIIQYGVDTIEELADEIIEDFDVTLDISKDDIFTKKFFEKLVNNQNSFVFSAYESDVKDFFVFVYKKGVYYTYYIPDEIRDIIKKYLNI